MEWQTKYFIFFGPWFITILRLGCAASDTEKFPSPPQIILQPSVEWMPFGVDRPVKLECEAAGEPQPTFRWTKNGAPFDWSAQGKRFDVESEKGTLVFRSPEPEDEGFYQCMASNKYGKAISRGVHLRQAVLESFGNDPPIAKSVEKGEPLTLPCTPPRGFPKPDIFWMMVGFQGALRSINNSRIVSDPDRNLHFTSITTEDGGDYYYACCASSAFLHEYKIGRKTAISVTYPDGTPKRRAPVLLYGSPPEVTVEQGKSVEIYCVCDGIPEPVILWEKDGKRLPKDERYKTIDNNRILKIDNVDFQDGGAYKCLIQGQQLLETKVVVQAAPQWTSEPKMSFNETDMSVEFECKASGVPEPKIEWYKNGVIIADAEKVTSTSEIKLTVLRIEGLKENDFSSYQCKASNSQGSVLRSFYINVDSLVQKERALVQLYSSPSSTVAVLNGTFELYCIYGGSPLPKVSWRKVDGHLPPKRYTTVNSGRTLKLKHVQFEDEGTYVCDVSNGVGAPKSRSFSVSVESAPYWTDEPENAVVPQGGTVEIPCRASGVPKPTVEWFINGLPISKAQDNSRRKIVASSSSLRLKRVMESDTAIFQCNASNIHGYVLKNFFVHVLDVPNPPRLIDVKCSKSTAHITWEPTGDDTKILGYAVQHNTGHYPHPDIWETSVSDIPADVRSFDVALYPWSKYTFRVVARSKLGQGLPSSPSEMCQTPRDVPYRNPRGVRGKRNNTNNLVISWEPMLPQEHHGPGFFYRVCFRMRYDWACEDISDWQQTMLEVKNKPANAKYEIKVVAFNNLGRANVAPLIVEAVLEPNATP